MLKPIGNYKWLKKNGAEIVGDFKWTAEYCTNYFGDGYNFNSDVGYEIRVSGYYPDKLHDLHDNYPFMPENTMFAASSYMRNLDKRFNLNGKKPEGASKTCGQTPKLIQSLMPKNHMWSITLCYTVL